MLTMSKVEAEEPRQSKIVMTGVSYAIIDQYKDLVYRTALAVVGNAADAEDIMQDVFFKYFQVHPQLENEQHEKAWFLRVTVNAGKTLLRSCWNRKRAASADLSRIPAEPEGAEHSPVLEAVLSLPDKYRIAIYLYYYEEYSIREIARLTEQSETAVAQQLSRGRKKLQKQLGGIKNEYGQRN